MKSPEGFTPPQAEVEKVAQEVASRSPEVEIAEVGNEQLGQYSNTAETYIDQQSEDFSGEAERMIETSAQSMNVSSELLGSVKIENNIDTQLGQIQDETNQIANEAKRAIFETVTETPTEVSLESETNLSWEKVFETPSGKEFSDAMRGVVGGKQDVTRSRITNDYSMREFVRKHPQEAQQFNDTFQKQFGTPHPGLLKAREEIEGLQQNPPEIPPEDPKYSGLSYRIDNDPEYIKLREDLDVAHKMRVFGTTNFKNIPLDRFMKLCSSDTYTTFSGDREAEKEFRKKFGEKSALYDEREKNRVYRDPDGVINRDRDPLFLKMFEPDSRGVTLMRDEALRQFAIRYPGKAQGYAEKYPDMQISVSNTERSPRQERQDTQTEREERQITTFEIPKVLSGEEVVSKISEQLRIAKESGLAFDEAALQERQKALAEIPIINSHVFREATAVLEEEPIFSWVETDKIVGRPLGDQNSGGWSFEYSERKGRIVKIAKELSTAEQDEQKIEHIFHPKKPNERIKLSVLEGPSGPIYSVEDGTHRVVGAMTAALREIPCDVMRIKYPLEQITTVESDISDWQRKIELGLIQGKVETLQNDAGKKFYKLIVQKEILPWIRTTVQSELIKINLMYERMYPNSLDKLDVPRDALVDSIANNYFMAGRWKEWEEKFSKNTRDKNRLIIYS